MIFENNICVQLVLFFAPNIVNNLLHQIFSERCTYTIFLPSERLWCVAKCLTEGWWWCSETSEIAILCSKQAPWHFWSVLSCSKKHSSLLQ